MCSWMTLNLRVPDPTKTKTLAATSADEQCVVVQGVQEDRDVARAVRLRSRRRPVLGQEHEANTMIRKQITPFTATLVVAGVLLAGCEMMNVQPRGSVTGHPLDATSMDRFSTPMVKRAVSRDMSISDAHFNPHTSEINELGVDRLTQLHVVLERSGGTVHYHSMSHDEDMIHARLASVNTYFQEHGLDMSNVTVDASFSAGRGMTAVRASRASEATDQADFGGAGIGVTTTGNN